MGQISLVEWRGDVKSEFFSKNSQSKFKSVISLIENFFPNICSILVPSNLFLKKVICSLLVPSSLKLTILLTLLPLIK